MIPNEKKELQRQQRAERNKAKMAREREEKRERQLKRADKEKDKANRELEAINNVVTHTDQAKKIRSEFEEKAKSTIGQSSNNKEWEKKRKDLYNQRVWKGWRESEKEGSVIISKIKK